VTGDWNPDYQRMLDALSRVQHTRAMGVGRQGDDVTLRFRDAAGDDETRRAIETLREVWGIDPDAAEYRVVLRVVPRDEREIAVLTTSMLDLMHDIARLMEMPPEHVESGHTAPTVVLPRESPFEGRPPISVTLGHERPGDAFVAVRKDGWWYSIARDDRRSKRVLLLLNILFQLSESGDARDDPVITVPAGG
jgi:hypothetical protein